MKKTGIIILSIGFLFTIFTTFSLLRNEHITDPSKMKSAQIKVHRQVWGPMVGAMVLIAGVGIYLGGRKEEAGRLSAQ